MASAADHSVLAPPVEEWCPNCEDVRVCNVFHDRTACATCRVTVERSTCSFRWNGVQPGLSLSSDDLDWSTSKSDKGRWFFNQAALSLNVKAYIAHEAWSRFKQASGPSSPCELTRNAQMAACINVALSEANVIRLAADIASTFGVTEQMMSTCGSGLEDKAAKRAPRAAKNAVIRISEGLRSHNVMGEITKMIGRADWECTEVVKAEVGRLVKAMEGQDASGPMANVVKIIARLVVTRNFPDALIKKQAQSVAQRQDRVMAILEKNECGDLLCLQSAKRAKKAS
jgi:hypothetical protein